MEFEEIVNSDKPVLVDFWATWCGPCRMMNPIIENIKNTMENVEVIKVNVDEERKIAEKYQIRSIPTLVLFKKGETLWRNSGVLNEDTIKSKLKQILN